MVPHVVSMGDIGPDDLSALNEIEMLMYPDLAAHVDFQITCHHVCAALAPLFPDWTWRSGWFGSWGWEHSWLDRGDVLLDPYPWCASRPILAYAPRGRSPWAQVYVEKAHIVRITIPMTLKNFDDEVLRLRAAMTGCSSVHAGAFAEAA